MSALTVTVVDKPLATGGHLTHIGGLSGMGTHGITFVDDDALADHDFAFVELPDAGAWIFYREQGLCPRSLEDSWAAYRALLADRDGGPDDPAREPLPENDPAQLTLVSLRLLAG